MSYHILEPLSSRTGNKILWDKAFRHDMRSKTGIMEERFIPEYLVARSNKGNEGSGNEIGSHNIIGFGLLLIG